MLEALQAVWLVPCCGQIQCKWNYHPPHHSHTDRVVMVVCYKINYNDNLKYVQALLFYCGTQESHGYSDVLKMHSYRAMAISESDYLNGILPFQC